MAKEKTIEDKFIDTIRSHGGYVIKNQASATTGKGRPDLSASINGKYYGIEVKRNTTDRKTTIAQLNHLIQIAYSGGIAQISSTTNSLFDNNNPTIEHQIFNINEKHILNKNLKLELLNIINTAMKSSNFQWLDISYNNSMYYFKICIKII